MSSPSTAPAGASSPFALAAGLIWQDRAMVGAFYLACIAPRLVLTLVSPTDGAMLFTVRVLERLIELSVLFSLSTRALKRLGATAVGSLGTLFLYFSVGILSWLTLLCPSDVVPFEILWTVASPAGIGPALFMALPAGFVWFLHFFWSFALLLTPLSLVTRINLCRWYTQQDPLVPIKCVLGPTAIMYLPTLLAMAPYPDGRMIELALLADALSGIQWILCGYLSLAFGIALLPDLMWRELSLDPYRTSRLSTIELQGPSWLAKALRPKVACQLLGLCSLLWAANLTRLAQVPPGPSLQVTRTETPSEGRLEVELLIEDVVFHYRAFRPLQFRLTNESGDTLIAAFPDQARIDGETTDVRVFFPRHEGKLSLVLSFTLTPSADGKVPSGPYQLWYGAFRVATVQR